MKRLVFALAVSTAVAAPLPAQTLSTLLPLISFPDTVTPSTKGCKAASEKAVCVLKE